MNTGMNPGQRTIAQGRTTAIGSPSTQQLIAHYANVHAPTQIRGNSITSAGRLAMYLERTRRTEVAFINMHNPMDMPIRPAIHRYGTLDKHGLQLGWDANMVPDRNQWYLVCPNKGAQKQCWRVRDTGTSDIGFRMLFLGTSTYRGNV